MWRRGNNVAINNFVYSSESQVVEEEKFKIRLAGDMPFWGLL